MDARRHNNVSCASYVDPHPMRMTSPTCKDLGIPTDTGEEIGPMYLRLPHRVIHNPSLHLDGLRYVAQMQNSSDPYSTLCMIPLPGALALHAATEPNFIRKRNERERERVRCVNEGYARLKEHLPDGATDKRLSKVDTLRGAIDYIRELQKILKENPLPSKDEDDKEERRTKLTIKQTNIDSDENRCQQNKDHERRSKTRRGSLSSEQSNMSDNTMSDSDDDTFQFVKRRRVC